jgi:phospholipid/cholesterol/gamma-HCH transport system ATP-binding protein
MAAETSFSLPKGGILGVFGDPGTGKSTLTRLAALREMPSEGYIVCFGRNVLKCQLAQLQEMRLRIGAVLEGSRLIEEASVAFNLKCLALLAEGCSKGTLKERTEALFGLLECSGSLQAFLKLQVSILPESLKKKVLFIRECLLAPELLVLDRPFELLGQRLCQRFLYGVQGVLQKTAGILLTASSPETARALQDRFPWVRLEA